MKRAGGVAQDVSPEFKSHTMKKKVSQFSGSKSRPEGLWELWGPGDVTDTYSSSSLSL
jgi:hypothetical protein